MGCVVPSARIQSVRVSRKTGYRYANVPRDFREAPILEVLDRVSVATLHDEAAGVLNLLGAQSLEHLNALPLSHW